MEGVHKIIGTSKESAVPEVLRITDLVSIGYQEEPNIK